MTTLSAADDRSTMKLDRVRSRERAVSRVFKGVVVSGLGWLGIFAVPVAEGLFHVGQLSQEVWSIGARSLVWLGLLITASAGTHLLRFGGRRGILAFASFAAAGACGLLAVAEQFETWFLDTRVLSRLDELALFSAFLLTVVGVLLLRSGTGHGDPDGQRNG